MSGQTNGGVFNPRNLSLFTYTYNNPVNLVDPDGMHPETFLGFETDIQTNQTLIYMNSMTYGTMDEHLRSIQGGNIQTDWFAAAQRVTALIGGMAALDIPGTTWAPKSWGGISSAAENAMQDVHFKLAKENQKTFDLLHAGKEIPGYEGLRGNKLDMALVNKEQGHVSKFLDEYFADNPGLNRGKVMGELSSMFHQGNVNFDRQSEATQSILKKHFPKGAFNMDNEQHRIKLGHELMKGINQERKQ